MKPLRPLVLTLLLAACQNLPSAEPASSNMNSQGQAFAQVSCGGCHATGHYGSSPNSNAPPFAEIVNKEGLTHETLSVWLRDAHNYPSEMDFTLGQRDLEALVPYMLTLKERDYRPPAQ